jgi:hypothetical protein
MSERYKADLKSPLDPPDPETFAASVSGIPVFSIRVYGPFTFS